MQLDPVVRVIVIKMQAGAATALAGLPRESCRPLFTAADKGKYHLRALRDPTAPAFRPGNADIPVGPIHRQPIRSPAQPTVLTTGNGGKQTLTTTRPPLMLGAGAPD